MASNPNENYRNLFVDLADSIYPSPVSYDEMPFTLQNVSSLLQAWNTSFPNNVIDISQLYLDSTIAVDASAVNSDALQAAWDATTDSFLKPEVLTLMNSIGNQFLRSFCDTTTSSQSTWLYCYYMTDITIGAPSSAIDQELFMKHAHVLHVHISRQYNC